MSKDTLLIPLKIVGHAAGVDMLLEFTHKRLHLRNDVFSQKRMQLFRMFHNVCPLQIMPLIAVSF